MKIAVATNNNETVAGHVGRCKAFLVYEIKDSRIVRVELRENSFSNHAHGIRHENYGHHHSEHGHGHRHGRLVEGLRDCEYLIFKSGGWRMIENLQENNIQPIITDEKIADDAVNQLIKGELVQKELEDCHQGHHHH